MISQGCRQVLKAELWGVADDPTTLTPDDAVAGYRQPGRTSLGHHGVQLSHQSRTAGPGLRS
jgi:hypothetical protein